MEFWYNDCLIKYTKGNIADMENQTQTNNQNTIQPSIERNKIAIFVDWENLRKDIEKAQRFIRQHDPNFISNNRYIDYNNKDHIIYFLNFFLEPNEYLYRIFFYTSMPLEADPAQNISEHPRKKEIEEFINGIAQSPYCALRLGKLKYINGNFQQKQVDMLMGLDIAHLSYNKLVDSILVFSKDTDIIPALKCARICGIQVKIAHLKEGLILSDGFKIHSDVIVEREYKNIIF
ncbi:hypothetical protein BBW65_05780 [Helicobacter enhydrae]|uniref:NYN domain-containing protein n=1 Tax=Helicobacter enhydrae TaxID=222136 RepID=A0A1B1U6E9_9HELI|nr:NYN domain-containing protein [Helicobacter enhydrae]ANV98339.1 hypothetical protein BBW65_05780 [Helicobacter enhydrae]